LGESLPRFMMRPLSVVLLMSFIFGITTPSQLQLSKRVQTVVDS